MTSAISKFYYLIRLSEFDASFQRFGEENFNGKHFPNIIYPNQGNRKKFL